MTKFISRKLFAVITIAVALCAALALTGCSGSSTDSASEDSGDKTIKVASVPTPHAEILNNVTYSQTRQPKMGKLMQTTSSMVPT